MNNTDVDSKPPKLSSSTRTFSLAEIRIISENVKDKDYVFLKENRNNNSPIARIRSKIILHRAMSDPRIKIRSQSIQTKIKNKLRKMFSTPNL